EQCSEPDVGAARDLARRRIVVALLEEELARRGLDAPQLIELVALALAQAGDDILRSIVGDFQHARTSGRPEPLDQLGRERQCLDFYWIFGTTPDPHPSISF